MNNEIKDYISNIFINLAEVVKKNINTKIKNDPFHKPIFHTDEIPQMVITAINLTNEQMQLSKD